MVTDKECSIFNVKREKIKGCLIMYRMKCLFSEFEMSLAHFLSCNHVNNAQQNTEEAKKRRKK